MRSLSGTDPDYVAAVEVFDNLSHAQIHQAVSRLDPAALSAAGTAFLTAATGLGDEVDNAHSEIRAALADGWRGGAAQQAADAVTEFEQAGRRIADVLTAVGVRLTRAGDAAESVRAAVAEPDAAQPDPAAALLDSERAADNATIARDAENARLDAVQAMETIYVGALVPTGSGVPSFPGLDNGTGGTVPGSDLPAGNPGTPAVTPAGSNPAVTAPSTTDEVQVAGVAVLPVDTTTAASGTPTQPTTTGSGPAAASAPATTTAAATPLGATQPGRVATTATTTTSGATQSPTIATGVPGTGPRNRRSDTRTDAAATQPASTESTDAAGTDMRPDLDATAAGGDAAAGMSAGAVGGLMGGAMAVADQQRAPGGPRHPAPPEEFEDDDEFLRFLDEEPTYLEPADEVNALIGRMDPTSPAVLGEWTERE
ncbi:WXG100 family type VII secretion target [Nocardia sp. NPDC059177]|uniref:WXG100 family type VII secretion target n=1 Tax=Nocardia sp. NPDC059177 TaxID=3346759 RepID=UPI0036A814AC